MNMKQLKIIVPRFRRAIEVAMPRLKCVTFKTFPNGVCGDACDMLGQFLQETYGLQSEYVSGKNGTWTHAWLEIDGLIIDITADQFPGNEKVVIANHDHASSTRTSTAYYELCKMKQGVPPSRLFFFN